MRHVLVAAAGAAACVAIGTVSALAAGPNDVASAHLDASACLTILNGSPCGSAASTQGSGVNGSAATSANLRVGTVRSSASGVATGSATRSGSRPVASATGSAVAQLGSAAPADTSA